MGTNLPIRWGTRIEYLAEVETVAAGGGSIAAWKTLRVGPQSSGAHPGPTCYGFEVLFAADVNLLLGRLSLDDFCTPVFPEASRKRLNEMISLSGKVRKIYCTAF